MEKPPLLCRFSHMFLFGSQSAIMAGCGLGVKIPNHKCFGCPEYFGAIGLVLKKR